MKLNLISLPSNVEVSVFFDESSDMKDCQAIRASARPINTALKLAQKRLECYIGLHPIPSSMGVALEGL